MLSPSQTFFFFDYETFGINPALDRPCQFAWIRTDNEFNIIGEPLVIYCQPQQDYLPQPEACLVTGITPQLAMRKGLPEPEFIARIHKEFSQPNTCSLGYNNIRFDDEVTRYTLYRNFFDPYEWSWKEKNSRWDLLDVIRTAYALRPDGIHWPRNSEGKISFKLEHLSVANGIEHENAHDAMADVIATIEMAKKVKQTQPKLFNYLLEHRDKNKLKAMIDVVNMTPLIHVSGMFGTDRANISMIAPIAWHPNNTNAVIAVDLSKDPQALIDYDWQTLKSRLYTRHVDLAPDELPVPLKLIHINKCPVLATTNVMRSEDEVRLAFNKSLCLQYAERLKTVPDLKEKVQAIYMNNEKLPENNNVDTQLYHGFFSDSDKAVIRKILHTAPDQLAAFKTDAQDKRIASLLFRYKARHFPATLSEEEQKKWHLHCQEYFEINLPEYIRKLDALCEENKADEKKIALLKALYQYVEHLVY